MTDQVVATLDGRLVDPGARLIAADDLGLLRGDGVFETTLAVDRVPRDLDEHLARMALSADMLDLTLPDEREWRAAVEAVLDGWGGGPHMVLRLVCTRGREGTAAPTAFVMGTTPSPRLAGERSAGIDVLLLPRGLAGAEIAAMPWLLPGAKTLSYAMNMAAKRYADAQGADDVVFVGTDGLILEGPSANVVIARGRTLLTPPQDGILAGITVRRLLRDAAAAGWATAVTPLRPGDLRDADGVWLASSVRLLAPVVSIDGEPLARGTGHAELAAILQVP